MNKQRILTAIVMMTSVGGISYPAYGQLAQSTQLAVEISGINEPQGQVCLNLFDSGNGFPSDRDQALQTQCIETTEELSLEAIFEDLAPGSYAVSVYHDANSNSEFDRNFVGMPAEGFGFSRNPDALTGPPEFGEAVVLVAGSEMRIEIELSYF